MAEIHKQSWSQIRTYALLVMRMMVLLLIAEINEIKKTERINQLIDNLHDITL